MRLNLNHIKVAWLYEDDIYLYESVPGSIVANSKTESIRFELRDLYDEDDNFEVIIQNNDDSYFFKTDYYEEAEGTFPLKAFVAQDEIIFYHEGSEGQVYFHLRQ